MHLLQEEGWSKKEIADHFGISSSQVGTSIRELHRQQIYLNLNSIGKQIFVLYAEGEGKNDLAAQFNLSTPLTSQLIQRELAHLGYTLPFYIYRDKHVPIIIPVRPSTFEDLHGQSSVPPIRCPSLSPALPIEPAGDRAIEPSAVSHPGEAAEDKEVPTLCQYASELCPGPSLQGRREGSAPGLPLTPCPRFVVAGGHRVQPPLLCRWNKQGQVCTTGGICPGITSGLQQLGRVSEEPEPRPA